MYVVEHFSIKLVYLDCKLVETNFDLGLGNLICVICIFVFPLNIPVLLISESCIKMKTNLNFYYRTSLRCLKRFYEGL